MIERPRELDLHQITSRKSASITQTLLSLGSSPIRSLTAFLSRCLQPM